MWPFSKKSDDGVNSVQRRELNPITIKQRLMSRPRVVIEGDQFILSYTEGGVTDELIRSDIGESMNIDLVSIFTIEDALGYKKAICGSFGEADEFTKERLAGSRDQIVETNPYKV